MTTTFSPATNIYAAIAAGPTDAEREAERRRAIDARLARQDRLRTAVCVTPEPPIPVVVKSPLAGRRTRGPERRDRADHARRKAAAAADYAAAFPTLQNRAEHGDLIRSLCARYDLSGSTMDRIAQEWRWGQGARIPSRALVGRTRRRSHGGQGSHHQCFSRSRKDSPPRLRWPGRRLQAPTRRLRAGNEGGANVTPNSMPSRSQGGQEAV